MVVNDRCVQHKSASGADKDSFQAVWLLSLLVVLLMVGGLDGNQDVDELAQGLLVLGKVKQLGRSHVEAHGTSRLNIIMILPVRSLGCWGKTRFRHYPARATCI